MLTAYLCAKFEVNEYIWTSWRRKSEDSMWLKNVYTEPISFSLLHIFLNQPRIVRHSQTSTISHRAWGSS